jgi:uncharacterized protein with NAD-binding domain and iron-sulfur cluster
MADGNRKKVAILGGGVGSMTAAYWLTQPRPDGPEYDVTVYQMGWRLGGKGASGRNQADGSMRIEEHGLHVWMGFYANAFRTMRNVYEENGRAPGTPLATWDEAFVGQNTVTLLDYYKGKWSPWPGHTPTRKGLPGDQTSFPTPHEYLPHIPKWLVEQFEEHFASHANETCAHGHDDGMSDAAVRSIHGLLKQIVEHAEADLDELRHEHLVLRAMIEAVQKLIGVGLDIFPRCTPLRHLLLQADFAMAIELGIIKSHLCVNGWTSVDDQEWQPWLKSMGMHKENEWGSLIRAVYDLVFGYENGIADSAHANLAAGTISCGMLRMTLNYNGSIFYKMQAGMGDTVFSPFYEVLKKRGVQFKFFHRLREVVPSADGQHIDELRIGVQARTRDGGEYNPLIDVVGLPCWPSGPQFEQLEHGTRIQASGVNLEDYDERWRDVDELRLSRKDGDFDYVVFGLSAGAIPIVCPRLVEQKENWRTAVEAVKVVRTQAFQLWLNKDIKELGWQPAVDGSDHGERAITGAYVEPLDTWADMSQLIARETWTCDVKNVAYFCGVLGDDDDPASVKPRARKYCENDLPVLWKNVAPDGKFHYDWLCVNQPDGGDPFDAQYFRANTSPTELYVLSVAGSTDKRIDPADTGYENLCVAGDWVRNGFALGCVESAVLGGMKGVQRLCPEMVIVE